jgi:hypothetical protein
MLSASLPREMLTGGQVRFFVLVAYCFGLMFAAVVSFGIVDTVYSARQVVNGIPVEGDLTRADLKLNDANVLREQHRIDLNQVEVLVAGNNSMLFEPIVWETGLGVSTTTYILLNFVVFALLAFVVIFFIRLGSDTHKRTESIRLRRR